MREASVSDVEPAAGPSDSPHPPARSAAADPPEPTGPPGWTGPTEPPTVPASVNLAPPAPPSAAATSTPPSPRPSRRRWLRWIRWVALVIALPVAALGIGLLVAWIVHTIRGNPATQVAAPAAQPSIPAVSSAPASVAPHRVVVVPSDWVPETEPPAGLTFRHPPGWIRRTSLPEILRFAPVSAGSTTPGVEGIGAGIEPGASPSQALAQFVTRAYGTQPELQRGPITAVAGAHLGELQQVVSYTRAGVPVRVVVHAFSPSEGRVSGGTSVSRVGSVVVLARASSAEPARAAALEAAVEASLQVSG